MRLAKKEESPEERQKMYASAVADYENAARNFNVESDPFRIGSIRLAAYQLDLGLAQSYLNPGEGTNSFAEGIKGFGLNQYDDLDDMIESFKKRRADSGKHKDYDQQFEEFQLTAHAIPILEEIRENEAASNAFNEALASIRKEP